MSWNPTSPLPGAAQTGFTSPTYTLSVDVAPDVNMIQHAVTALGGTQPATVDVNSVARPFTITIVRPKTFRLLGQPNPVTGVVSNVQMNRWKFITRKGVTPLSGQSSKTALITTTIEVPAGSDSADADNLRAALSAHIGALNNQSANLGNSLESGVI